MQRLLIVATMFALVAAGVACAKGSRSEGAPIAACSSVPVGESAKATKLRTFTDEDGAFSISYPRNWHLDGPPFDLDYLEFFAPEGLVFLAGTPSRGGYNPNVTVLMDPSPAESDVAKFVAVAEKEASEVLDGYKVHSKCTLQVGDKQGLVSDSEFDGVNGKSRHNQLNVVDEDVMWTVTCTNLVQVSLAGLEGGLEALGGLKEGLEVCGEVLRSFRLSPQQ